MSEFPEDGAPPRRPYSEDGMPAQGDDGAIFCSCGEPRQWPDENHHGAALICPVCDSPGPVEP